MRLESQTPNINREISELNIQRLSATGEVLAQIEEKIAELVKRKVGKGGRLNAMHEKMHTAAEKTDGRKIVGINDDIN